MVYHGLLEGLVDFEELVEEDLGHIFLEVGSETLRVGFFLAELVQVDQFIEVRVEIINFALVEDDAVVAGEHAWSVYSGCSSAACSCGTLPADAGSFSRSLRSGFCNNRGIESKS